LIISGSQTAQKEGGGETEIGAKRRFRAGKGRGGDEKV